MHILPVKKLLLSNHSLKVISLIFGYIFWYMMSAQQTVSVTTTIPLCFTSTDTHSIQAPEEITVTLQAKRSDLYLLDTQSLAAHIDITHLSCGKHDILLTAHHILVPSSISVAHYRPLPITITVIDHNNNKDYDYVSP